MMTIQRKRSIESVVLGLVVALYQASALAQTSTQRFTMQGQAEQSGVPIKDALGHPCLDVEAAARPQAVNRDMMDHVVSIKNNCPRTIQVKACYYKSDRCNELRIQGYKRADMILGSMRNVNFFRYSISQQ